MSNKGVHMNEFVIASLTIIIVNLLWNLIIVPLLTSSPKNGVFIRPKD
jgi:hypothetical protein